MMIDDFALYGTRERPEPPVSLDAGRLRAELTDGNLRTITYDGVEVLRAVSFLVRDRDWGTCSPVIEDLKIDHRSDGFEVAWRAHYTGPEGTVLVADLRIQASGTQLEFVASASSATGFETNRCGFCILHPVVGLAGSPVEVEHVDGSLEKTRLPDLIEPWQPFMDMRAITHTVTEGVTAECRMEGDTFEMEDQRNWSDASYKTYVRPLALPWPYRIAAGDTVNQRIALTITDRREMTAPTHRAARQPIRLEAGEKIGRMPSIGLIVNPEEARATLAAREVLDDLEPQELLFHYDPVAGHGLDALKDFAEVASRFDGSTLLEIALPCRNAVPEEVADIARQLREAGFRPDAILISPSVDRQSTPPGSEWPECPPLEDIYSAAHEAFPDTRIGGGMLSYFTELNRKRVPADTLAFISHCTNPVVHAADDLSVMQTLEALPFITRSVRAVYGDKPYRIGPSTIPMRQNPYGSRTMDNPDGKRIPMANRDPRHNARFAEAFALGYAIQVLDANLECLTLAALTGTFGLIAGEGEPVAEHGRRPIFNTLKLLASLAGKPWRQVISSSPSEILAFTTDASLHIVNLTAEERVIEARLVSGSAKDVVAGPYAVVTVPLS